MVAQGSKVEPDELRGGSPDGAGFSVKQAARARRLLLIDEREDSAASFRDVLGRAGIAVVPAVSIAEARILNSESEYDVVVVNERLPDGSGMDLLRELVADVPSPQILMLAGEAQVADVVECMRLGAVDYLIEPLDPAMLRSKVETAFDTATLRKQNEILTRPTQKSNAYFDLTESSSERIRSR